MKKDIKTMIVIIALGIGIVSFNSVKSKVSKQLVEYTSFVSQKTQINMSY